MQVIRVESTGKNFKYIWPNEEIEIYEYYIDYKAVSEDGDHLVRVGYCLREVYGSDRMRVNIWIDNKSQAQFVGADDFDKSGEVLSVIKYKGGRKMCGYPDDIVPERYRLFNVVGLPNRIKATGVHNAWAVAANIADHKTMIALAGLRRREKQK